MHLRERLQRMREIDQRQPDSAIFSRVDWRSIERMSEVALEAAKQAIYEELVTRGLDPRLAESAIAHLVDAVRAYDRRTQEIIDPEVVSRAIARSKGR